MKADKMRLLAKRRKEKRNERLRNKLERKQPTTLSKIFYKILMLRISIRALYGKSSIQINGPISCWMEMEFKNEGYSVYTYHAKTGKVLYTVIGW